jgi:site-specific recombinase XerD
MTAEAVDLELAGVLGDAWVKYQREAHRLPLSPETLRSYLAGTNAFLTWVAAQEKHDHPGVLSDELTATFAARDYVKHLLVDREAKPSTAKAHVTALGNFYWSLNMAKPKVAAVAGKIQTHEEPKALTREESVKVFRAAERAGIRDHAIVMMMYGAGARIQECHDLNAQDVRLSERIGEVTIRYGKGGKQRTVPLNGQAVRTLRAWTSVRHHQHGLPEDSGPYFINPDKNKRLAIRSIREVVYRVAEKSGVEDLTPHTLRHTYGTNLARAGADPFTIQDLMGHSSVETAQQYSRSNQSDRRAAVEHLTIDY